MEWTTKTFIDKANLFWILSQIKWRNANKDSEKISSLLAKYGVIRGDILDLMCGDGRISIFLAKKGYRVTGVDFSPFFIKKARENARKYNVSSKTFFILGDARQVDEIVNKKFDAVIIVWQSLGYYEPETDKEILSRVGKIVKPMGLLVLYDLILREKIKDYCSLNLPGHFIFGDFAVRVEMNFIEDESRLRIDWSFYRTVENRMLFLGHAEARILIYSLKELISMLSETGWEVIEYENPYSEKIFYIVARAGK
ncbi:MAG: class I SAM-dependent methyltransferase [Candidatus Njordarchaeales archaeon]